MFYESALVIEHLITHFTCVGFLTTVHPLMSCKTAHVTECLITYLTQVWTLTPLYITGISTFSTVFVKFNVQNILVKSKVGHLNTFWHKNNFFNYGYTKYIQIYTFITYITPWSFRRSLYKTGGGINGKAQTRQSTAGKGQGQLVYHYDGNNLVGLQRNFVDWFQRNTSVNAAYYASILRILQDAIKERSGILSLEFICSMTMPQSTR
jgi:hypothetical protein